jgi:hypothetical protein
MGPRGATGRSCSFDLGRWMERWWVCKVSENLESNEIRVVIRSVPGR